MKAAPSAFLDLIVNVDDASLQGGTRGLTQVCPLAIATQVQLQEIFGGGMDVAVTRRSVTATPRSTKALNRVGFQSLRAKMPEILRTWVMSYDLGHSVGPVSARLRFAVFLA